jgi:TPR repeat protein
MCHDIGQLFEPSSEAHDFKKLADHGHMAAQFNYALMHFPGDRVLANKLLAAHYFKLAADQGHLVARFHIGVMLSLGEDIELNTSFGAHNLK